MNVTWTDIIGKGIYIVILLAIGIISTRYLKKIIYSIFKVSHPPYPLNGEQQTKVTIIKHVVNTLQYVIWIVIVLAIGYLFKLEGFIQILSTLGVMTSIMIKDVVVDIMTGLLVLGESQFKINDVVTIDGKKGIVKKIGLRTTELLLEDNSIYICANRLITSVIVHHDHELKE